MLLLKFGSSDGIDEYDVLRLCIFRIGWYLDKESKVDFKAGQIN